MIRLLKIPHTGFRLDNQFSKILIRIYDVSSAAGSEFLADTGYPEFLLSIYWISSVRRYPVKHYCLTYSSYKNTIVKLNICLVFRIWDPDPYISVIFKHPESGSSSFPRSGSLTLKKKTFQQFFFIMKEIEVEFVTDLAIASLFFFIIT